MKCESRKKCARKKKNEGEKRMQTLRSKTTATAVAIFLMLTITITLVALPIANAHYPAWTDRPTRSYISVSPNPIGINQQVIVVFWLDWIPPGAQGAYGDRWKIYVDVTKPDGTKETLGPFTSDPVGGSWTLYTPTQMGVYSMVARFPGQTLTGYPTPTGAPSTNVNVNDTFAASTSEPYYLTVQQEQIQQYQETPLPTGYWTRPINAINRDWWQVSGYWLGTSSAAHNVGPTTNFGYGTGPESAHVLWTRPYWAGGLIGGNYNSTGYGTGSAYEGGFTPPIIWQGRLYYNVLMPPRYGWYCVDLYTGETLFFHNTTGPVTGITFSGFDDSGSIKYEQLAYGQIYYYDSPNQHGGWPYLWSIDPVSSTRSMEVGTGDIMRMFDAFTGNYICSIANTSNKRSGTQVYGTDGSLLWYNIATTAGVQRLTVWNTSRALWVRAWTSNTYWMWRPYLNRTFDGNDGYSLNVTIPQAVTGTVRAVREGQYIIGGPAGQNDARGTIQGHLWALSLKPGQQGTLLWNITFAPPKATDPYPNSTYGGGTGVTLGTVDPEDGVFIFEETTTRKRWGYSLATGQQLWGPTASESQLNYYGMSDFIYQGKLFSYGYGGELIAYNITTGKIVWNYTAKNVGFESPYGNYPLSLGVIADGKIYMYSSEHSYTNPLWRGSYLRCIDAETGEELWKLQDFVGGAAIADGYIITLNNYDEQIYCIGKGPSATTVSAPQNVIAQGQSLMITGTVTDQSAGAKGTPAVSDADQELWMEYLYMQRPMPTNAKGVEVSLDAIDPNNNYIHIDTVTSDTSGMFKKMWTPDVPGEYTVIATFAGSKSYGSSNAETAVGVSEALPEPAKPEPAAPLPPFEMYTLYATIAIIIAVAIATLLLLRKK